MCGLYSFRRSPEETRTLFQYIEEPDFPPRAYVAPASPIAIVRAERGERHFALVRWGLIPAWVKEVTPGRPLINARGETVLEKPSFRNAMKRRRCLIPADGFYEWKGDVPGKKQPFHIHRPGHALFAFAGLWEHWQGADGSELRIRRHHHHGAQRADGHDPQPHAGRHHAGTFRHVARCRSDGRHRRCHAYSVRAGRLFRLRTHSHRPHAPQATTASATGGSDEIILSRPAPARCRR